MQIFSSFSVDDAELALSEKQKKRQIFTGNMSYLTYYCNLKMEICSLRSVLTPSRITMGEGRK